MTTAVIALRQSFWPLICVFCFYEPPVQTPLKNTHSFSAVQLFLLQYPESFRSEPTVAECGLSADATEYIHIYNTMRFPLGLVELWRSQTRTGDDKKQNTTLLDGLLLRKDAGQIRCMSAHLLTEAPLQSLTMFSCGVGEIAFISQIPVLASLAHGIS